MQVALAWLLQQSPNILVIPGTSSIEHLQRDASGFKLKIPPELIADLDAIAGNTPEWEAHIRDPSLGSCSVSMLSKRRG